MGRKSTKKLYQFVDALVATGMRELVGLTLEPGKPLDDEKARTVMLAIAKSICFQYARSILYVPVDLEIGLSQRDRLIWTEYGQDGPDGVRKFTPERVAQIAEAHQLTVSHIYCIARMMHKTEIASRQGRLPGLDDEVLT